MTLSSEVPADQDITILLVEDDPPTLWRLRDALAGAGFDVAAAATLGEAHASLAKRVPRVLLTDLQLPDGHGIELIREMRQRLELLEQHNEKLEQLIQRLEEHEGLHQALDHPDRTPCSCQESSCGHDGETE